MIGAILNLNNMRDFWNDPPEYPEAPECCEDEMEINDDGSCVCAHCGKRIEPPKEYEDSEVFQDVELPDDYFKGPEKCPHGREWTDCDACDYLSDLAYDAARESK